MAAGRSASRGRDCDRRSHTRNTNESSERVSAAEGRNQAAVGCEGSDSDKDTLVTVGRNNLRQSPIMHKDRQTAAAGRNLDD